MGGKVVKTVVNKVKLSVKLEVSNVCDCLEGTTRLAGEYYGLFYGDALFLLNIILAQTGKEFKDLHICNECEALYVK
jgi:hypothetical protein